MKRNHKRTIKKYALCVIACGCMACSCRPSQHYDRFSSLPGQQWVKTDSVCFDVERPSADEWVGVHIGIRYTEAYPYQNFWVSVTHNLSDSATMRIDTLEIKLNGPQQFPSPGRMFTADGAIPQPIYYRSGQQNARVKIVSLMRDDVLPGICDVGLSIGTDRSK